MWIVTCLEFLFNWVQHDPHGLKLTVLPKMVLNFWSSCLYLPSAGLTGIRHRAWFWPCWKCGLGFPIYLGQNSTT